MNEYRWQRFVAFAERALQKPNFDLEERVWRIQVAQRVRNVLEIAAQGGEWIPVLRQVFSGVTAAQKHELTTPAENTWFEAIAGEGGPLFDEVLSGFLDESRKPTDRFQSFADAIGPVRPPDDPVRHEALVGVFGSLFNFAVDPEGLPFLRTEPAEALQRTLGHAVDQNASATEKYQRHLRFAEDVRDLLREARVQVRDMIDVSSLIFSGSRYEDFWALNPQDFAQTARQDRRANPPPAYLSVCAIYRDEAPYLAEWIEFHRLVGVERFFLYDNMSQDDHLEVLAPYLEEGTVVVQPWRVEGPAQAAAYEDCLKWHRYDSRWIAFIDVDEFLFSPSGRPVSELLREYEAWPGVGVNWALHGFSGHRTKPAGLVIENYVRRVVDRRGNTHIKSIVDPTRVESVLSPHNFKYAYRCAVDENHYPVDAPRTKSVSSSRLRVNHYHTKSEEEFLAKIVRPRADGVPRPDFTADDIRLRREFQDAQEEADGAILIYLPALRAALQRRSSSR